MTLRQDSHLEWLSLVEVAGVFLAPQVLEEVFPQGLDTVETVRRRRTRSAWEEWREAVVSAGPDLPGIHRAWISLVLGELLEYGAATIEPVVPNAEEWTRNVGEPAQGVCPAWIVRRAGEPAKMAVFVHPSGTDLKKAESGNPGSPVDRATAWCRAAAVRTALITDGEAWTLLDAPDGTPSGRVTWYARLWWQEEVTLRAFYTLLRARRTYGPEGGTFPALLEKSLEHREEITDTLGVQVERAVEVLVRAVDRADRDRRGELLRGVTESGLYEAGLTVMMRLVVILSAEERGLLLLGDPVWDGFYAVSTLRAQLEEVDDHDGHGVLERRNDAWSRLLAVFRAVYAGVDHEALRLPALGGSLFDPDRFPFLEGRAVGSSWRDTPAEPLPIDNRTVLLLLNALQKLNRKNGAQLLSYRALDVEQIGHVYEGLLERTVRRMSEVTLGLEGSAKIRNPDAALPELESAKMDGADRLVALLAERTGRSESAVTRALARPVEDVLRAKVLRSCEGDRTLADRVLPFVHLLRTDPWEDLFVYLPGAFAVTSGSDRRDAGAHYTPKALTEKIVATTLVPLVYVGPAEGLPRDEWTLRSAAELLDLKICDPAMGSGAFLVQTCRWLGERLVHAWTLAEAQGLAVTVDGEVVPVSDVSERLPTDAEERLLLARRLVAERCLYGVDVNPVAVELAKLSIWLVTLAKNRPFGFLDHNLRHGNSLLGLRSLDQLTELRMKPQSNGQQRIFALKVTNAVEEAIALRARLRATPIRDIRDVEAMARLDREARSILERPELAADALVGEGLRYADRPTELAAALNVLSSEVGRMLEGIGGGEDAVKRRADAALAVDLPHRKNPRKPFHWPLEFPEVFEREGGNGGFDAFVGNPPFLGGQKITGAMGTAFRDYLVEYVADGNKGSADLVAYFFLSCFGMLRNGGTSGLLAVNTIAEGDTRDVGLTALLNDGAVIFEAHPNEPWPGTAAVVTSRIHMVRGAWDGSLILSGQEVELVSAFLTKEDDKKALKLKINAGKSFQGSITLGMGFVFSKETAESLLSQELAYRDVVFPYLIGDDLTSNPRQTPSRWVANFWDWPLSRDGDGVWSIADFRQQRLWLQQGHVPSDYPGKVAEDYPAVLEIIKRDVKPERQRRGEDGEFELRSPLPEKWWIHAEKRPGLYHAIGRGEFFFVHPKGWEQGRKPDDEVLVFATGATKYPLFESCPNDQIFANTLGIVALFDFASYAILNSGFHTVWAWKYSSSLETRMRYTPTDCFETFPFPQVTENDPLFALGEWLKACRREAHDTFDVGLTGIYNRFHDPEEVSPAITALRKAHVAVDERAKALYGYDDLDLEYSFHEVAYLPTEDRTRYTVSEKARLEILRRLAALNVERYEDEQAALELPTKAKPKATKKVARDQGSPALFDSEPASPALPGGESVLDVLRRSRRWFGKDEILKESRLPTSSWKAVVDSLLKSGVVEREGEKRGTKYRLKA